MHLIPTYIKGKNALKLKVPNYSCNQILFKRQKAKYTYFEYNYNIQSSYLENLHWCT